MTIVETKLLIKACNDTTVRNVEIYKYGEWAAIHVNYKSGNLGTFKKGLNAEESLRAEKLINRIYEIKDNLLFENYKELL